MKRALTHTLAMPQRAMKTKASGNLGPMKRVHYNCRIGKGQLPVRGRPTTGSTGAAEADFSRFHQCSAAARSTGALDISR
jgi:hypothetical protein